MKTFLDQCQQKHRNIHATCKGNHTCGQCKIKMKDKKYPVTCIEKSLLTDQEIKQGIRLACCHNYQENVDFEVINYDMNILDEMYICGQVSFQGDGNGLIVDIGTTTIVMKWISLLSGDVIQTESFQNPQAIFGGDVISRIEYSCEHPHSLHQLLIDKIESILLKNQDIEINKMVVCGNTVMTNLFLDCDISSLGHIPFDIPIKKASLIDSSKIFKNLTKSFEIYTFPHIAAFVGGDITAGILALDIYRSSKSKMLIDLGTNGEIVIGNKHGILTTSTAAGPAFEGVGIHSGGPSISGAISKVILHKDKVKYETLDNQPAICICGSGLISLMSELRQNEIIDELGRFTKNRDKFYITPNIYITEDDIQKFQLAKAAIQSGIRCLLKEHGEVDEIFISGGFGSHLNVQDLVRLKVIPEEYKNIVKNVKNSALSGSYKLLSHCDFKSVDQIISISNNIDLATYEDFQDDLIDGLYF